MKSSFKLRIITLFAFFLATNPQLFSQPNGFNYQAVARSDNGEIISNTSLTVQFRVLTESGILLWEEQHIVNSGEFGLFNLIILSEDANRSGGSAISLGDIPWAEGGLSLNVRINSGSGLTDIGTVPFLAVPYALYALNSPDADPVNEIQDLQLTGSDLSITGNLSATTIDLAGFTEERVGWRKENENVVFTNGNVGVGTLSPEGRLTVSGVDETVDEALFMVTRKDGYPVFAVYEDGVYAFTDTVDDGNKGKKGGFAVGGYNAKFKGPAEEYMRVTADSIRFYVNQDPLKGKKGGFAVGGYNSAFKGLGNEFLRVTPDSVRVYIDDNPNEKGLKGGFAVGGYNSGFKGDAEYFNISSRTTAEIIPGENRLLWYPNKNAFMVGNVLVEAADSVGENSMASGYQSQAKGAYSEAFGYRSIARGSYSTAIGRESMALSSNTFSAGYKALASGLNAISFGYFSSATSSDAVSIGNNSSASGLNSVAMGNSTEASADNSVAMGSSCIASAFASSALGYNAHAVGPYSVALGTVAFSNGDYSSAFGRFTEANSYNEFVIGQFNESLPPNSATSWNSADAHFIIGNGTSAGSRSNSFVVYKNGNVDISGNIEFNGYLTGNYGTIARSTDEWLRLNPGNSHSLGTYIEGLMRADGGVYVGDDEYFYRGGEDLIRSDDNIRIGGEIRQGVMDYGAYAIQTPGTIYANAGGLTAGSWTSSSDERLKQNIHPIDNALSALYRINGVRYSWRSEDFPERNFDKDEHIGIIAQELEKVFPELVIEDSQGMKAVAYDKLSAVLLEAIKEQQRIIEQKEQEIEALSGRLSRIEVLMGLE